MWPVIEWEALVKRAYPEAVFLLDPYITRGGITFLWGDTSIGKTPLMLEMAACIGEGQPFFGLRTRQSRVLIVETDMPEGLFGQRLKAAARWTPNVSFIFPGPMSIPFVSADGIAALGAAMQAVQPDLVCIDTLRFCHDMDDRESRTPKVVYSFFRKHFPGCALLFVHHEKKKPSDPKALQNQKESFSGAKNWLNDAQVGIHLERFEPEDKSTNLRLYHWKSQVSEQLKPMRLLLGDDGMTLSCPLYDGLLKVQEALGTMIPTLMTHGKDSLIASRLGVSNSTARRRRILIESGDFPGRGFLAKEIDSD